MSEEQQIADNESTTGSPEQEEMTREPIPGNPLRQIVEGLLMAADKPLSLKALAELFSEQERPSEQELREALALIEQDCEGRGFELREVSSGFRFQVRESLSPWVSRLWEEKPRRYTRATLETLALVAYRQPITRGDIEEIRGVSVSSTIIRSLLDREWVRVVGHRDVPGRPAMFATTRHFLDYFNLGSLQDLPPLSEIRDLDQFNRELELEEEQGAGDSRVLDLPDEEQEGDGAQEGEPGDSGQDDEDDFRPHYDEEELPGEEEARKLARKPLDEILGSGTDEADENEDGRNGEQET